ncbi:MAG: hypothetical protein IJ191_08105 [Treponema sp.]|nr:hypothetical protein [Treponema sp.]
MKRILPTFLLCAAALFVGCTTTGTVEPTPRAPVYDAFEEEYLRSIDGMEGSVSREEFASDKQTILTIITELGRIMNTLDYDAWIDYVEPNSVTYWRNQRNLTQASRMLPNKNQRLKNLRDYFTLVFVPARTNRQIDEIRYISNVRVKAVQVQDDSDIIFYNFVKQNGKWLVYLPPLER